MSSMSLPLSPVYCLCTLHFSVLVHGDRDFCSFSIPLVDIVHCAILLKDKESCKAEDGAGCMRLARPHNDGVTYGGWEGKEWPSGGAVVGCSFE